MITRHNKQYVLFAGLLDEAHTQGLRGIDTELVQVPTAENGNVAVVKAVVEMEDGRTFSGIGDASPENVGRNIVPHIIRMAETRSKARALRDAVNVGVTALEELSDSDEDSQQAARSSTGSRRGRESSSRGSAPQQRQSPPKDANESSEDAVPPINQEQIDLIHQRATVLGDGEPKTVLDWLEERWGYPVEMMTQEEGVKVITLLDSRIDKRNQLAEEPLPTEY